MNIPTKYPIEKLIFACVFEGGLLLIAYVAGWFAAIDPLATVGRDWIGGVAGLVAVIPMLVLLRWGLSHPAGAVGKVTMQAQSFVVQFLADVGPAGFAVISVMAGVCEEALFRGFFQVFVAQHSTEWIGLIVASLLFGLAHAVSRAYAIAAAVIGVYLGLLYLYTGSIVAPIVCHAVYDFIALVWLVRSRPVPPQ